MTLRALCTRGLLPVVALALCAAPAAHAAWPNSAVVNVPLCTAVNNQQYPLSVPDGTGGAIVIWEDNRQSGDDIYAQRLSADGKPQWTANGVSVCLTAEDHKYPAIASDGAGGAIITWQDSRGPYQWCVCAQRISADGVVQWKYDGVVLCTAASIQSAPTIISDGAGGAIVAWWDLLRVSSTYDLYAQRISANGTLLWPADGVALSVAVGDQVFPTLVSDGSGGVIATWNDRRSGFWDVYAQRISGAGTVQWNADGVVLHTTVSNTVSSDPVIVSDGAGGAIVAWWDSRSGNGDVYAQRLAAGGALQWTVNGLALCTAVGDQWDPAIVSDGAGGAIVTWNDDRSGSNLDIYAQRISAGGTPQWTVDGVALSAASDDQVIPAIVSDGMGGAIATWRDAGNVDRDVYAQRVSAAGAVQWTANGVPLCIAAGDQQNATIVADGRGGAIIAWQDGRNGSTTDIYAQRVDRWGYLGVQPAITGVHDVPADEGGHVTVSWNRSPLDTLPGLPISTYYLWRQAPRRAALAALARGARLTAEGGVPALGSFRAGALGSPANYWEYVASATATGATSYSASVATAEDSTGSGNPRTLFMVEAATATTGRHWESDADSGYSVDNLAPASPAAFRGEYAGGTASLAWDASPAADLAGYRLHRGATPEFAPAADNLVATLDATGYVDVAGGASIYKLCAVDVHGNVSAYAVLQPGGTAGVESGALPRELALSAPAPNPLRGQSALRLALPRAARVSLAVFDQQGRCVRTLVDGPLPAGERSIAWDGRDGGGRAVPSALYFVRLAAEGRTLVSRLAVVR